jgi:hypothetical protein
LNIYLSSKGVRPDIDNAGIINRVIASAKEGSTIVFKEGIYPIGSTIFQGKKLHWEGEVTLQANRPITMAHFTGGYKFTVSGITFKGSYSIWDGDKPQKQDGILISAVMNTRDCSVLNAWGNGITVSADIATGRGNASACRFDNLSIGECRDNGIYFQGGDANQCTIINADVRDCNGIGIWDNSFLGNQFFSCMTHNNKKGSYKAGDEGDLNNQNSRAGFFGCYAEMGQGPVILCGSSQWFGGLPSDGFKLYNNAKTWYYGNGIT